MGKVLAEVVGLRMAPQPVIGTDPTAEWTQLQPNKGSLQGIKRANETVERNIHSKNMTREAGDVVGWKVNPQFAHTFNKDFADSHAEAAFRCLGIHPCGVTQRRIRPTVAVDGGAGVDSFTVPNTGVALPANALIYVRGCANAQNNGVFVVQATTTTTSIKVPTGSLAAEAALPANATIDVIGLRGTAGNIQMDASGNLTTTGIDLTTFIPAGLIGSRIVIGSGVLGTAATSFTTRANNAHAYIKAVAAATLTLERHVFEFAPTVAWAPAVDAGGAKTIDILFGSFYRNYAIDDASHLERILCLEKEDPRAGSDGTTRYTYCKGLAVNTMAIAAPLKQEITATISYVGLDATKPLPLASRLPNGGSPGVGPGTAFAPLAVALTDTNNDLKLIRMTKANGILVGEINTWTLTLNNNVSAKEVQGTPGAVDHEWGEFGHSLQTEAYYNNASALDSATDNDDLQWDAYVRNHQFAFNLDLPRVKIRNDELKYEANKQVRLTFDTPAFRNEDNGIAGAMTLFGFVPDRS